MTTTTRGSRYGVLPWVVVVGAIALSSASNLAPTTPTAAAGSTGTASTSPSSSISGSTGGNSTCGNCTGNNGNGSGNGGSTGTGSPGHSINVTGQITGAIAPGARATLNVTVANLNNQSITVRTVTGSVTSVGTAGISGKPACDARWFSVSRYDGALVIAKNGSGQVPLTVTLANLTDTNQDNCKSVKYTLAFSATADGV